MAKEESPGLFGKVVRFVRSPVVGFEIDAHSELPADSGQGRQLLKELMERRRRNDFVRRREFDQLRRLRRSGMVTTAASEGETHLSSFDSVLNSRSDDRATTLRKIDEIEEQMSQQWWKTRPPRASEFPANAVRTPGDSRLPSRTQAPPLTRMPPMAADTQIGRSEPPVSFAATSFEDHAEMLARARAARNKPDLELPDAVTTPAVPELLPPVAPAAPGVEAPPSFVHHPLMEEAAIQFANAEAEAAEQTLCALLDGAAGDQEGVWLALFDLYRASGRPDRFDAAAIAFAERFGRSPPLWFSLATPVQAAAVVETDRRLRWRCPPALGVEAIARLEASKATDGALWLDWSALVVVEGGAALPLQSLFSRWSQQALSLRFQGAARLMEALGAATRPGDPTVDAALWTLRMEALRLLGEPEAFDAVALDYCITYEVSPPSWHAVHCDCRAVVEDADDGNAAVSPALAAATRAGADAQGGGFPLPPATDRPMELAGAIAGGAMEPLLELLDIMVAQAPGPMLVVDCERLVRIDFLAAGSLLGWAAAQQSAGHQVQFRNLHRLAATFFNVVGIAEHAQIHARSD